MIIVAGGTGTRMGAEIPKQFIELNGKPILMHTLERMHAADKAMELILVLPANQLGEWKKLCNKHAFSLPHATAEGGDTRFLSVKSGLQLANNSDLVGVHDGVRPLFSASLINRLFEEANKSGATVPVTPVIQSLRKVEGASSYSVDRSAYRQVQTPQCFKTNLLQDAFVNAKHVNYSDDAAVVEANGKSISLLEGDLDNIKITTPIDLQLAELIIARLPK